MSWRDNASQDELERMGDDDAKHFGPRKAIKSRESELMEENENLRKEIKNLKSRLGE